MPVKPDLHIKEEPDGPVLKRCRTVSPSHMVLPNVMEMIAALGPALSPYQGLTAGGRNTPDYNRPGKFNTEGFPIEKKLRLDIDVLLILFCLTFAKRLHPAACIVCPAVASRASRLKD